MLSKTLTTLLGGTGLEDRDQKQLLHAADKTCPKSLVWFVVNRLSMLASKLIEQQNNSPLVYEVLHVELFVSLRSIKHFPCDLTDFNGMVTIHGFWLSCIVCYERTNIHFSWTLSCKNVIWFFGREMFDLQFSVWFSTIRYPGLLLHFILFHIVLSVFSSSSNASTIETHSTGKYSNFIMK